MRDSGTYYIVDVGIEYDYGGDPCHGEVRAFDNLRYKRSDDTVLFTVVSEEPSEAVSRAYELTKLKYALITMLNDSVHRS